MDTLWFEALTIILVMVYAVILFTDMATAAEADVDPEQCYGIMSREDQMEVIEQNKTLTADCELVEARGVLYVLDFTFLSIFVVEIIFRLLGYGVSFLRDPVQFIDARCYHRLCHQPAAERHGGDGRAAPQSVARDSARCASPSSSTASSDRATPRRCGRSVRCTAASARRSKRCWRSSPTCARGSARSETSTTSIG